jgi:hypothetical protein
MQFVRRLWLAAACTFAVLVAAPAVQAQATKILPADTELVFTVNLQQILNSDVLKSNKTLVDLAKAKIQEQLDEKEVGKYLKKSGFDIFKDLSSMTVAMPAGRTDNDPFILLQGNFDAEKIEGAIMEASKEAGAGVKVKNVKIANTSAFEVVPQGEKTLYIGILDKKTMIACAAKNDFAEAVARFNGTKAGTFKAEVFKSLLSTTNNKQSLSFVATGKLVNKLAENNPNANNDQAKMVIAALKNVEGFSAAITIAKDIDFQLGVNAKDAETAQQFAGMANAALILAKAEVTKKAKAQENLAPVVDIVNTLKADANGANLIIRGQITFATLEKLLQNLPNP